MGFFSAFRKPSLRSTIERPLEKGLYIVEKQLFIYKTPERVGEEKKEGRKETATS